MSRSIKPTAGATGFEIFIETKLDLSTASGISIKYRKPDGTTGSFTGTAETKAAARSKERFGAKYVTSSASDLDQAGEWEFQVSVVMPTFAGAGLIDVLEVGEAL